MQFFLWSSDERSMLRETQCQGRSRAILRPIILVARSLLNALGSKSAQPIAPPARELSHRSSFDFLHHTGPYVSANLTITMVHRNADPNAV
jgi:hypothetical protein